MTDTPAPDKFVDSAKSGLTSKIGGIPFYVYGGAFVIGFYLWKHYTATKTPPVAAVTPDLVHPGGLPSSVGSGAGVGPSSGFVSGGSTGGGVNTSNTVPGQLTATDWINQGTAYLAALGYDGTKANQYLSSYTTGVQPTGDAARYVNLALSRYGSPTSTQAFQPGATLNSPTLVRFVAKQGNPAVFAQYSDGSLHWVVNPDELRSLVASNPDLKGNSVAGANITFLGGNDPLWSAAGVKFSTTYPYTPITADTPGGTYAGINAQTAQKWLPNQGTLIGG